MGAKSYKYYVIKSSTGAFFKVPFRQLYDNKSIDEYILKLKSDYPNIALIGTSPNEQKPLYKLNLNTPLLLLLGNETDRLNRYLTNKSDQMATIPMVEYSSVKSLNVSCAASILFYEILRQRS